MKMRKRWVTTITITVIVIAVSIPLALKGWTVDPCPEDKFTIVLLPDTQYYSLEFPAIYSGQMSWIVDNEDEKNIVFVIHLGDITDENTRSEWETAREAHDILDENGIPYSMLPGNHDYPEHGYGSRDTTRYNEYFGPDEFETLDWAAGGRYGYMEENKNDYNYTLFDACGMKFMVVSLAFAPTAEALRWANRVIEWHSDRRVIVATHAYLKNRTTYYSIGAYGLEDGNGGQAIWDELVSRHDNIFMVVCGHVADSERRMIIRDTSTLEAIESSIVHEILTDYQYETLTVGQILFAPVEENCGNGWLRTLTFVPSEDMIYVESVQAVFPYLIDEFNYTEKYSPDPNHDDHKYERWHPMED